MIVKKISVVFGTEREKTHFYGIMDYFKHVIITSDYHISRHDLKLLNTSCSFVDILNLNFLFYEPNMIFFLARGNAENIL